MIPLTELPRASSGMQKAPSCDGDEGRSTAGAYRQFPTDLHIPPVPWRSDLLTTSTLMQGAAAQEACLERWQGDFFGEQKTNQGKLPQAWIPPSTDKLLYAASCETRQWGQCQDPMNRAM